MAFWVIKAAAPYRMSMQHVWAVACNNHQRLLLSLTQIFLQLHLTCHRCFSKHSPSTATPFLCFFPYWTEFDYVVPWTRHQLLYARWRSNLHSQIEDYFEKHNPSQCQDLFSFRCCISTPQWQQVQMTKKPSGKVGILDLHSPICCVPVLCMIAGSTCCSEHAVWAIAWHKQASLAFADLNVQILLYASQLSWSVTAWKCYLICTVGRPHCSPSSKEIVLQMLSPPPALTASKDKSFGPSSLLGLGILALAFCGPPIIQAAYQRRNAILGALRIISEAILKHVRK